MLSYMLSGGLVVFVIDLIFVEVFFEMFDLNVDLVWLVLVKVF